MAKYISAFDAKKSKKKYSSQMKCLRNRAFGTCNKSPRNKSLDSQNKTNSTLPLPGMLEHTLQLQEIGAQIPPLLEGYEPTLPTSKEHFLSHVRIACSHFLLLILLYLHEQLQYSWNQRVLLADPIFLCLSNPLSWQETFIKIPFFLVYIKSSCSHQVMTTSSMKC